MRETGGLVAAMEHGFYFMDSVTGNSMNNKQR